MALSLSEFEQQKTPCVGRRLSTSACERSPYVRRRTDVKDERIGASLIQEYGQSVKVRGSLAR